MKGFLDVLLLDQALEITDIEAVENVLLPLERLQLRPICISGICDGVKIADQGQVSFFKTINSDLK